MRFLSAGLTLFALCSGCALDTRALELGSGAQAGDGQGGSPSASSGGSVKPPDPIALPICTYGSEAKPGCETVVENAGFSGNIEGWEAEPLAITVGWAQDDANQSVDSGSLSVINSMHSKSDGIAAGAGMQCLKTQAGQVYDMAGDILVPEGQGEGVNGDYVGQAGFSVMFWPNDDCASDGHSLTNFRTALVDEPGAWRHVQGTALAPDGALSMSMRVLTIKSFKQFTFEARFDNVLLQQR